MKRKTAVFLAAALGLAALAKAAVTVFSGFVVNQPALAYSANYPLNISAYNIGSLSAVAAYSSATIPSVTFKDGTQSTGTITIPTSVTTLSAASAVNALTVVSNTGIAGKGISIAAPNGGGFVFLEGRDFKAGNTSSNTATSIAAAMASIPGLSASASGSVVYSTFPTGVFYNGYAVHSNSGNLSWANANYTGGQSPASVFLNGTEVRTGVAWTVGGSSLTASSGLASAINANTSLSSWLSATDDGTGTVSLLSKLTSSALNLSLATNAGSGVTFLHANMTGATDSAYALNGAKISIASHGLSLALPVLYTSSTVTLGGLVNQTTYYAIPVDANTIELATTSARALAGQYFVLTSSFTGTTAHTFTLAPLPFVAAATTGFKWQASNDNSSWSDLAVSTVSWIGGGGAGTSSWNFGSVPYSYIRAAVVGPSAGGLNLQVTATGQF